ncbi:MAG TPA: epoxyqueuosine reductase QueH [Patescibacteria group bacterium]|nr:epoxyqueuosine reductase QueH [Patescibacteria group bacterium]
MQKLLLHTCCAPCSAYVLKLLETFDVSVFYYNPNIDTADEYEKRKNECQKYCEKNGIKFIEITYQPKEWQLYIEGLESEPEGGKRCEKCFELRLTKTAEFALKNGFDYFATTLSISPHKNSKLINEIGNKIANQFGLKFLEADWKKEDGYKKSCEISRNEGFYRQNYCGCKYSNWKK